jgi:hypothetical protein
MPICFIVNFQYLIIIFVVKAAGRKNDAGGYETVLYNNVHNRHLFGYGFYLQWGIFTQPGWWGPGTSAGKVYRDEC